MKAKKLYSAKDFFSMYDRKSTVAAYRAAIKKFLSMVFGKELKDFEEIDKASIEYLKQEDKLR